MKETDLAGPVLTLLDEMGFDCYQEVTYGGPRADIAAVKGSIVAVVELKSSLTFEVIAQAKRWNVHLRFVAVPKARSSDGRVLAMDICRQFGVGIIEGGEVRQWPRLNRTARPERLLEVLRPEHKTYAPAGTSAGRYWSPWKESVRNLVDAVRRSPGIPLRELVRTIKHHWANERSARSCIARQIADGTIPGLNLEGGKIYLASNYHNR